MEGPSERVERSSGPATGKVGGQFQFITVRFWASLGFCPWQLIYARFSLSRTETVPFMLRLWTRGWSADRTVLTVPIAAIYQTQANV